MKTRTMKGLGRRLAKVSGVAFAVALLALLAWPGKAADQLKGGQRRKRYTIASPQAGGSNPSLWVSYPFRHNQEIAIENPQSEGDAPHHLQQFISDRAPWFEQRVKGINWATVVQFEHRLAERF